MDSRPAYKKYGKSTRACPLHAFQILRATTATTVDDTQHLGNIDIMEQKRLKRQSNKIFWAATSFLAAMVVFLLIKNLTPVLASDDIQEIAFGWPLRAMLKRGTGPFEFHYYPMNIAFDIALILLTPVVALAATNPRKWLRLHLSTAIFMVILGGLCIHENMTIKTSRFHIGSNTIKVFDIQTRGWPINFLKTEADWEQEKSAIETEVPPANAVFRQNIFLTYLVLDTCISMSITLLFGLIFQVAVSPILELAIRRTKTILKLLPLQ